MVKSIPGECGMDRCTDHHDITGILWKMALNTIQSIKLSPKQSLGFSYTPIKIVFEFGVQTFLPLYQTSLTFKTF